jgi:hypothetical protein
MLKKLSLMLVLLMLLSVCTAHGLASEGAPYTPPAADVEAELTIMMWSGDGSYMTDIGHKEYAPEELMGMNQAAAYATAKAFNLLYPNVKINIFAKVDDPNSDDMLWAQHIENFRAEYGRYPDFYAATDIPGDILKGMCADISVFANDPVYQTFNEGVMAMMNYGGRQFALPQYLLPWGVYVNRSLADANNIDVPDPDWNLDTYTAFVSHSAPADGWYGAMDCPLDFLRTGSKDFAWNLVHRQAGDPYVNLASDGFLKLMEYIPRWANHAVWPQNDLGNTPEGFMDEHWWWGFRFFQMGKLLTLDGDPWMMGDLAHPNPEHSLTAAMADWDIYPRPATPELGNTVGVVLDPFAIHNYYADPGVSEEEAYQKLQIAYEFAKFWCADTRAIQARADQMFLADGVLKPALNDSLPLVTGDAFAEQMQIWYSTQTHQRFGDADKMPGFQKILELWEKGDIWDVSDKAYPWRYEAEGSTQEILFEYFNSWNPDISGARRTEANWLDNVKARMPDWNALFNTRFAGVLANIDAILEADTYHYNK